MNAGLPARDRIDAAFVVQSIAPGLVDLPERRVASLFDAASKTFDVPEICVRLISAVRTSHRNLREPAAEEPLVVAMLRLAERALRANASALLQRVLEHLLRMTPGRVPADWGRRCVELIASTRCWDAAELIVLCYVARTASRFGDARVVPGLLDPESYGPGATEALSSLYAAATDEQEPAITAVLGAWEAELRAKITALRSGPEGASTRSTP